MPLPAEQMTRLFLTPFALRRHTCNKCTRDAKIHSKHWGIQTAVHYQRHCGRRSSLITFCPPPFCPAKVDGEKEKRNKSLLGDVSLLYRSLCSFPLPLYPLLFLSSPFVILAVCLPSSPIESGRTSKRTITHVSMDWPVTGCNGARI